MHISHAYGETRRRRVVTFELVQRDLVSYFADRTIGTEEWAEIRTEDGYTYRVDAPEWQLIDWPEEG